MATNKVFMMAGVSVLTCALAMAIGTMADTATDMEEADMAWARR